MNMNRFHKLSHKVFGVLLAYSLIGTVFGLHRLWMRQKYWYLHPLAFVVYMAASNRFIALNADSARQIMAKTNNYPHFFDYSSLWLLLVGLGWIVFIIYDCVMVWSWPVPVPVQSSPEMEATP